MSFPADIRTKVLLWCDRHCCLCKKACDVNIEVHHLLPKAKRGTDEIDNAIPLCFDCHGRVEHYNPKHPKGNMYKIEELKARRNQIYDEFTQHLVPPIHYEVTQSIPKRNPQDDPQPREFPDVSFNLKHLGDSLPVHVRIIATVIRNGERTVTLDGHYGGKKLWRLNPHSLYHGHFIIPEDAYTENESLILEIQASIIDQYEREHQLLPIGYGYLWQYKSWYLEP